MNPTQPGEAATPAINTSKRLFDLVRFMRSELHAQGLITDGEYEWLCTYVFPGDPQHGSPSPRRLEDYDDLRARFAALEAQLKEAQESEAAAHGIKSAEKKILIAEIEKHTATKAKLAEAEKDAERLAGAIEPFAKFACDEPHVNEPACHNCVAREALAATPEQALKEKEGVDKPKHD